MSSPYRLASAMRGTTRTVYLERNARLYPFSEMLEAGDLDRLGGQPPEDLMPLLRAWTDWDRILPERLDFYLTRKPAGLSPSDVTFCPPVALPNKLICIGSNYHDHIAEMPIPMVPTYPYSFLKPPSTTLRGSGSKVAVPSISHMLDWEAELAVIIGQTAKDIPTAQALGVVAGYANLNDLSARDWLEKRPPVGVDWIRHKAFDGFAPMGPYMMPARFVGDPQAMPIRLSVNGVVKQNSNTNQMVFGVADIVSYLSGVMTLEPGDVIATGTPAGVGYGRSPQEFLKSGDVVDIEIGDLGVLHTPIM